MAGARKAWNKATRAGGRKVKAKDYPKAVRAYARKHGTTYDKAADAARRLYMPDQSNPHISRPGLGAMYGDALKKTPATREKAKGRRARRSQAIRGTFADRGARAFRRGFTF